MAGWDIIMVRQKELKRLHVIRKGMEGTRTQRDAAGLISLSGRQIRRIVTRIREDGIQVTLPTALHMKKRPYVISGNCRMIRNRPRDLSCCPARS
jgi:hypothetical protein